MLREDKRTVLITAAGGGIGKVIAQAFAGGGDRVLAADIDRKELDLLSQSPGAIETAACDLGIADDVEALMDAFLAMPGDDRVLVNCVGIAGPIGPAEEVSDEGWQRTFDVNLTSIFRVVRRAIPAMKAARRGSIVNIATLSVYLAPRHRLAYVASKAGLLGMTRGLAKELGPFGIRCNAILPGPVKGDRMRRIIENQARDIGVTAEELERTITDYIALRSFVDPEDIANATLFLASPAAAKITGEELDVSGLMQWEE